MEAGVFRWIWVKFGRLGCTGMNLGGLLVDLLRLEWTWLDFGDLGGFGWT